MPRYSLLLVTLIVTWAWTAGVHADDREPPLAVPANLAMNQPTTAPGNGAVVPPAVETAGYSGRQHSLGNWIRNHKPGCWAHHNELTCGSCQSECRFIFGSCRAFFGEPCLSGAIPPVFPGDYGYPHYRIPAFPGDYSYPYYSHCRRCP